MHGDSAKFIESVSGGLGLYYLLLGTMNWVAALLIWRRGSRVYFHAGPFAVTNLAVWFLVGLGFLVLSPLAYIGHPLAIPAGIKDLINRFTDPRVLIGGSLILMVGLFVWRKFFSAPPVAWTIFNGVLLLMGAAMTDPNFTAIVAKPDNVPIVGLVYLLGFFTWLATHKAVINDERARQGLGPTEKLDDEKILVWPDLVYTELICMVALTAFLLVWGILLQAPLEEPASSVKTPNPSKAPWYFLGLQEMLVYFDPWYAGVVLPTVVLAGLMAIPFLDFNKQGNGYYTIEQRKFSYLVFQTGFLLLWVVLIVLGTFLRGPNWNIFGPFEYWDSHKVLVQNNRNLSYLFWVNLLNQGLPKAPDGSSWWMKLWYIVLRESPGIVSVVAYFLVLPPVLASTRFFRKFFVKMGFIRFMTMMMLLLLMGTLPIKMILRWAWNLKYIINIDEFFLNF